MESNKKPMNLAVMSQPYFTGMFLIMTMIFIGVIIIGALGPTVMNTYELTDPELDMTINGTTLFWAIENLDTLNQQLLFDMKIKYNWIDTKYALTAPVTLVLSLESSDDNINWNTILSKTNVVSRTLTCRANAEFCDEVTLVHLSFIAAHFYRIEVQFLNLGFIDMSWVGDITWSWTVVNHMYTMYELWTRFTCVVLTLIATTFFWWRMRSTVLDDWTLEQKWVLALLFALVLYGNPLFPLEILMASWAPALIDSLFTSTFFSVLLFFWVCYFGSIAKTKKERTPAFYFPKALVCGLLWIMFLLLWTWQATQSLDNVSYDVTQDESQFIFVEVGIVILLIAYTFQLTVSITHANLHRRIIPEIEPLLNFMAGLTFLVMAITVLGLVIGFLNVFPNNTAEFLTFYVLFHLYIFMLVVCWVPASNKSAASHAERNEVAMQSLTQNAAPQGESSGSSVVRFSSTASTGVAKPFGSGVAQPLGSGAGSSSGAGAASAQ